MDGQGPEAMPATIREALAQRLEAAGPQPGASAFLAIVGHLHRLAEDLRASPADLRRVVDFLTEVGEATDARRQEWVLLADVLGLTALVEDHAQAGRPAGATPGTTAGPFWREDVPELAYGADLCRDGRGVPLVVQGRIESLDGRPVCGAQVDVWHANAEGLYENQDPDRQPEFNLRGRFRSDADGQFRFRTVRPGRVRLPADGPVGRLAQALGLTLERPAHIHFRVSAAGHAPLVTHVFDRDDPAIGRDALFGVKPQLLGDFRPAGPERWELDITLVLAPAS
jgi:protocatechuate 3,4-dioxygenase beta subunit